MKRYLPALAAVLVATVLVAAVAANPRRYPNPVVHVHVLYTGQQGMLHSDLWYDATARVLRATISPVQQTIYLSCPLKSACLLSQVPGGRLTTVQGSGSWPDLLAGYLPRLPTGHPPGRPERLHRLPVLFFDLPYTQAPMIHRQFWLDPRSGLLVLYRETASGQVVLTLRFDNTVLPPGSLPATFFQPPDPAGDWQSRLRRWLALHIGSPIP